MLHTLFQAFKPRDSEKDFENFSMYYYGLNLERPGAGPSWAPGLSFQQS